ncbi:MAG: hypothetical protein FGM24_00300 [Candidatus Kapabacteria bacterium]|nr:hypothetical protein [Candidatus Kapabacteria bacterium]
MRAFIMTHRVRNLAPFIAMILMLWGCSEHSHGPDGHDHDVVSRVEVSLVGLLSADTTTYVWEDADGAGGNNPNRIDTIVLEVGKTYVGSLRLLNSTVSPVEDLTSGVRDDMDQHQFFFTITDSLATITIQDYDDRSLPVGLSIGLVGRKAGTGSLGIELSHFDDPTQKTGVNRSDETDVSVTFPLVVR